MSERVESRRMQRARRRRRRLIAKMIWVLLLFIGIIAGCLFLIQEQKADRQELTTAVTGFPNMAEYVIGVIDTESPVIQGVKELTVPVGGSVAYKRDIMVTDNMDEDVQLTVDTSQVDLLTVGDYPITYIAADRAGNESQISTIVHVVVAGVDTATEDLVNAEADKLLKEIITDDMSQYDKAKAIFFWVHENVAWSDHTPKTDWIQGAYRGLVEHKGDCFVYASTSKCLLNRAGIKNMDIAKIPAQTEHYWNLIDIGEGWHHFDNTRRKDGHYFFYCTDEEVMAYSRTHNDSHNYDPSQYPDIK